MSKPSILGRSAGMEEEGPFSTLSWYKDNGTVVNCQETPHLGTEANRTKWSK